MFTQATSAAAVANAAHVAVQGQAVKQFGSQGVVAASGVQYIDCGYGIAASQAALAGTPNNPVTVFGLRVKITNSPLNFKYGVYTSPWLTTSSVGSTRPAPPSTGPSLSPPSPT